MFRRFASELVTLALLGSMAGVLSCNTYHIAMASPGALGVPSNAQLWEEVGSTVVLVLCEDGSSGSGVVVGEDLVLTANHVVTSREGQALRFSVMQGSTLKDAELVKALPELDLALVRAPGLGVKAARLSRSAIKRNQWGELVFLCGHPLGVTDPVLTEGRVSDTDDHGLVRYTAPTYYGNSGGPVFVKLDGHFVLFSLCQMVYVDFVPLTHMGLGAQPSKVYDFIEGL